MRTRLTVVTVLLGIVAGQALAQTPDNDKIIKYYRKKNNVPPAQAVTVTDVKAWPIKGAKQGVLEVGTAPQVRQVPFTMSADGRYILFAAADDITVDPSKAVMSKINIKDEPFRGNKDAKVTIVEYSDFQ